MNLSTSLMISLVDCGLAVYTPFNSCAYQLHSIASSRAILSGRREILSVDVRSTTHLSGGEVRNKQTKAHDPGPDSCNLQWSPQISVIS